MITDELNVIAFDLATFNLGPIAFGAQQVIPPAGLTSFTTTVDLRPENSLLVKIEAGLDKATGLLTWRFTSLDPETGLPPEDPLAGFLPPGVGGSVLFTVMPKPSLPTGTEIRNSASIVFDVNAPIVTPEWLNTIDNDKPLSQVLPLPASHTSTTFDIQWQGTDIGAGVQDFTVFVSEDGGLFTPFVTNTASTSAAFTGVTGHTYSFYSIARDLTGNVEDAKSVGDATTRIVSDSTPPLILPQVSGTQGLDGWHISNVTVTWDLSDPESGIASSAGCDTMTLTEETPGFTITCMATNGAGLSNTASVTVKIDKTPPTLACAPTPAPNANGWNNTDVTVDFSAADALSGLASVSPVVVLTTEGADQVVNGMATDVAGNQSAVACMVSIDKTAPEAFLQFDPEGKDIAVFGRDPVSGAALDPVPPLSATPAPHDDDDDDEEDEDDGDDGRRGNDRRGDDNDDDGDDDDGRTELRTYEVVDLAGNSLTLVERVKKAGHEIKAELLSLQYQDAEPTDAPENKQNFQWATERDGSLKELEQKLEIGKGRDRQDVEAKFEGRKNETTIKQDEPKPETRVVKPGLVLLRLATDQGNLAIEF